MSRLGEDQVLLVRQTPEEEGPRGDREGRVLVTPGRVAFIESPLLQLAATNTEWVPKYARDPLEVSQDFVLWIDWLQFRYVVLDFGYWTDILEGTLPKAVLYLNDYTPLALVGGQFDVTSKIEVNQSTVYPDDSLLLKLTPTADPMPPSTDMFIQVGFGYHYGARP